jgi:hypothetical protein
MKWLNSILAIAATVALIEIAALLGEIRVELRYIGQVLTTKP